MRAVNHVKALPGGQSEPHVFLCDDRDQWVLKLPGNPFDSQLGHDYAGLRIARLLGVPAPESAVVEVDAEALGTMQGRPTWVRPGLALGTRFIAEATVLLSESRLFGLQNESQIGALVVADALLETLDRRRPDGMWNLLLVTDSVPMRFVAIDFGLTLSPSLDGNPTPLLPAAYPAALLLACGRASVEAALTRLRETTPDELEDIVRSVPVGWLSNWSRSTMISTLHERRARLLETAAGELLGAPP